RGQLNGVDGQADLATAAKSLTGTDPSTAFAVSQSPRTNGAIAAALGPSLPSQVSGGSVVQALIASPVWSFPRSARSALNNTYKWVDAKIKAEAAKTQSRLSSLRHRNLHDTILYRLGAYHARRVGHLGQRFRGGLPPTAGDQHLYGSGLR